MQPKRIQNVARKPTRILKQRKKVMLRLPRRLRKVNPRRRTPPRKNRHRRRLLLRIRRKKLTLVRRPLRTPRRGRSSSSRKMEGFHINAGAHRRRRYPTPTRISTTVLRTLPHRPLLRRGPRRFRTHPRRRGCPRHRRVSAPLLRSPRPPQPRPSP